MKNIENWILLCMIFWAIYLGSAVYDALQKGGVA